MLEYRADGKKHINCFANVISKYQMQTFLASKKSIFFKKKKKHNSKQLWGGVVVFAFCWEHI